MLIISPNLEQSGVACLVLNALYTRSGLQGNGGEYRLLNTNYNPLPFS